MITPETMFDSLLLACPSFQEKWRAFVSDWEDEPETAQDGFPYYIALGDLADHVTKRMKAKDTSEFAAIFRIVERWHVEGDHYVREAATIGFLEALQGCASEKQKKAILEFWLLPESKKWWIKLNEFWDGNHDALRD